MADGGNNGGQPAAPQLSALEVAEKVRRGFYNLLTDAIRVEARQVSVVPLFATVKSVKLGKPTKTMADVTLSLPRSMAEQLKTPEMGNDVAMMVIIPNSLVERIQKPTLYDAQGDVAS